jgi:hypothetical protein
VRIIIAAYIILPWWLIKAQIISDIESHDLAPPMNTKGYNDDLGPRLGRDTSPAAGLPVELD